IIVFHRPNIHDKIIVHRVIEINEVNGVRVVTTKGDANPSVIPGTDYPITEDDYIGKVIFVIPKLGYVTNIIPPPVNYIIVAIIILAIFFNTIKKNKDKSDNLSKFDHRFDDPKDDDKPSNKPEY
ncbi:MAG: signal peptidase I, partial [Candidatus Nitrosothermus koennekii]